MKKFLTLLAVVSMAGVVQANVWNVNWSIMDAFSPADLGETYTPSLLTDYNVTWNLIYGSNLQLDENGLLSGEWTLIDSMTASAGDETIGWTYGTKSGTYDATLYPVPGSGTTYFGSTELDSAQTVYQYIFIDGPAAQEGETGKYAWLSDGYTVTPVAESEATMAAIDLGSSTEIAHPLSSGQYSNAAWKPVTIPEPATMSLLGLGALAMVLRRRIRR